MDATSYKLIEGAIAERLELDRTALQVEDFRKIRDAVNNRLHTAWEHHFWPWVKPATLPERRRYRPLYSATEAVVAGAERYFPRTGQYYQALQAGTGNAPATDSGGGVFVENSAWWAESGYSYTAAWWATGTIYAVGDGVQRVEDGEIYQCITAHTAGASFEPAKFAALTEFDPTIAMAQTGETEMGRTWAVWSADPSRDFSAEELEFELTADAVRVRRGPATVWLEFATVTPDLWGDAWSNAISYLSGQQVFYDVDFWKATAETNPGDSPETAPGSFTRVQIPRRFKRYLEAGAAADILKDEVMAGEAEGELARLVYVVTATEQQTQRTQVNTR